MGRRKAGAVPSASTIPRRADRFTSVRALRHAPFRRIWLAFVVSQVGSWMQITARAYLVFELTGSASALGTIYLVSYAPQLVLTFVGGALADRLDRKRIEICGDVLLAVKALAFGMLVATDTATLANLVVLSLVDGIVRSLKQPAGMALLPTLVPRTDLPSAVSLQGTGTSLSRIVGPLLAGVMIPLTGAAWVFHANAVSFAFVIGAWWATEIPRVPTTSEPRTLAAIASGLRHVRDTPTLRVPIVTLAVLFGVGVSYQPLAVAWATDVLADGASELGGSYYGFLQAAMGLGSMVGIMASTGWATRRPAATVIGLGLAFSAALMSLAVIEHVGVALAVSTVLGGAHLAAAMVIVSIAQHEAPEALRGRVMGAVQVAWIGFLPFTSQAFGWLADRFSLQAVFLATGGTCLAYCLGLVRWRGDLRLRTGHAAAPVPSRVAVADTTAG